LIIHSGLSRFEYRLETVWKVAVANVSDNQLHCFLGRPLSTDTTMCNFIDLDRISHRHAVVLVQLRYSVNGKIEYMLELTMKL